MSWLHVQVTFCNITLMKVFLKITELKTILFLLNQTLCKYYKILKQMKTVKKKKCKTRPIYINIFWKTNSYSLNTSLNCKGPPVYRFFSINTVQYCKCILPSLWFFPIMFLFSSLLYYKIPYIMHAAYEIGINWLFMRWIVMFWGSQKLYTNFQLQGGRRP